MIRYSLKCPDNHAFDSWFQSAGACDTLVARGMVACPVCGSTAVQKSLMAPAVRPGREAVAPRALSEPSPQEAALAELRRRVEENSEYVGMNFATEARAIHDGEAPERAIFGEARPEDARKLIEDGVPVAPLPFLPARRTN